MADSDSSPVYDAGADDPEMLRAYEAARESFRYMWREICWDRQRIVPALGLAAVKAPFSDGDSSGRAGRYEVEHMWLDEIDFDGSNVCGNLLNSPNELQSIKAGDSVEVPLAEISDWIFAINDRAYGSYTVNLLRSRMGKAELQQHDAAWGLDFGDPHEIRLTNEDQYAELNQAVLENLREELAKDPMCVHSRGHRGWTLLHSEASMGHTLNVGVLLEAGADPEAPAENGVTPRQLAQALGWDDVAELLGA